jgi:O-antigen biosynthesis protein
MEPRATRDVMCLEHGTWRVTGPQPLIGMVPEDGGLVPIGDVRLEVEISDAGSTSSATLLVDTGSGFRAGVEFPLPAPRGRMIVSVVTLPASTVALGLDPGSVRTFKLGAVRAIELSVLGAFWAHGAPQLSALKSEPGRLVLLLARAARLIRYRGPRGVIERLRRGTQRQPAQEGYEGWARRYATLSCEQLDRLHAHLEALSHRPTFSLLLKAHHASGTELQRTLNALEGQVYPEWELILTSKEGFDELREWAPSAEASKQVRWVRGDAVMQARGEFVARLAPGDALSPDALFAVAEAVGRNPGLSLLYTDSDEEDANGQVVPVFRPQWSPELLRSRDYVGRAAFFRTERVRALAGSRNGLSSVSQHDLLLQYTAELSPERVWHLPRVLLHTRLEPAPTSEETLNAVRSLQASLDGAALHARAELGRRPGTYRVRYDIPHPSPLVTVVIPTRDHLALLTRCIQSVQAFTDYRPLEILVVDNASRRPGTRAYLRALEGQGAARVLRYPHPFNFSAMNNLAANAARGELLSFLNNDIEAFDAGWLTEMVGLALQPGVGAVGAKLLYPDQTVQHAGTVAGLFGVAAHGYVREPREADGYLQQLQTTREVAAVTAACMVVRRDRFLEVGGFDEAQLAVAFNDVDFCFKLLRAGYRNIWTPYAELYHRESASRGNDERRADRQRFLREESVMRERWGELIERDPYYSPNLSLDSNTPTPAWPPRFRPPWISER